MLWDLFYIIFSINEKSLQTIQMKDLILHTKKQDV